jgi:hypothetical protein
MEGAVLVKVNSIGRLFHRLATIGILRKESKG